MASLAFEGQYLCWVLSVPVTEDVSVCSSWVPWSLVPVQPRTPQSIMTSKIGSPLSQLSPSLLSVVIVFVKSSTSLAGQIRSLLMHSCLLSCVPFLVSSCRDPKSVKVDAAEPPPYLKYLTKTENPTKEMKRGLGWDRWMGKEMDGEMDGRWIEMDGGMDGDG